jgi:hypothetical protein
MGVSDIALKRYPEENSKYAVYRLVSKGGVLSTTVNHGIKILDILLKYELRIGWKMETFLTTSYC